MTHNLQNFGCKVKERHILGDLESITLIRQDDIKLDFMEISCKHVNWCDQTENKWWTLLNILWKFPIPH